MNNKEKVYNLKQSINMVKNNKQQLEFLKEENKGLKEYNQNIINLFDKYNIKDSTHFEKIMNDYNYLFFNIKNSEYIKELKNIKHDICMYKYENLCIQKDIYKLKLREIKIKKIKEDIKRKNTVKFYIETYNKLEKEYEEWEKIPKCISCNSIFNNNNIKYNVKSHNLDNLCYKCINEELKKIIREKKFIREVDDKYKNSKIINKLLSKSYYDLSFYNDIYIENQKEKIDLRDDEVLKLAGIEVKSDFDKYKLSNLCFRANNLIELFSDKIKLFNFSEWYLSRIGVMEFEALKAVISEKIGYPNIDDIISGLNINNEDLEPDSEPEYESDGSYDHAMNVGRKTFNLVF